MRREKSEIIKYMRENKKKFFFFRTLQIYITFRTPYAVCILVFGVLNAKNLAFSAC